MSRTPLDQPRKAAAGTRSFKRRRAREQARAARRRAALRRVGSPRIRLRVALSRLPVTAWVCALIALLNATAWSIITPPFQGRDEVDHFAYVARIAETGQLPNLPPGPYRYPAEETLVSAGLHYPEVRFTSYAPSIASVAEQEALIKDVNAKYPLNDSEGAGGASREPPLFYALQTIPYGLGEGNVLVQLQLMRLLDALLGGITALLIFLFLRETLPGLPWAATVGAICVALQPEFASVAGSLNPDALLYALSAGVFLCLARAFRCGLRVRLAVVLGLLIAAGLATYYSFIGVALGAVGALALLGGREFRARGRRALAAPLVAIGISIAPAALDALIKALAGESAFGQASSVGGQLGAASLLNEISYAWQMYLPRLPGMTHYFVGIEMWREVWFDRSVGLYGWMDTTFPGWAQNLALLVAATITILCLRELLAHRHALKQRLPELAGYAAITVGLLAMLGFASYSSDVVEHEAALAEPRYLLPLLPLLGIVLALAVRGAGRRLLPIAGAALVVVFLGHDLFSQMQVIARYYG